MISLTQRAVTLPSSLTRFFVRSVLLCAVLISHPSFAAQSNEDAYSATAVAGALAALDAQRRPLGTQLAESTLEPQLAEEQRSRPIPGR